MSEKKEGTYSEEALKKLQAYVQSAKQKGFTDEQITQKLKASHIPDSIIETLFTPQKKILDSESYTRDKDVFTQDDFEKLENTESKSFFGHFKKKKSDDDNEDDDKKNKGLEYTTKQISKELTILQNQIQDENITNGKQDGKIEVLVQKNEEFEEQLETFGEKVGELRSTVLGRERMFNKLEDDFSNIKYVVNTFKPENLEKRFSQIQSNSLKHDSKIEKTEMKLKNIEEKIAQYIDLMRSIKSYEHVLKKLEELKHIEKTIETMKSDIDRTGSRMEIIFHNLEESIGKINETSSIAENNQSSVRELMVSLSKIEAQDEFFVKKEDFDLLKSDLQVIKRIVYNQQQSQ